MARRVALGSLIRRSRTPLAVLVVLSALLTPLLGSSVNWAETGAGSGGTSASIAKNSTSAGRGDRSADLRPLPLIEPGGLIETSFPGGQGLDDLPKIKKAVDQLTSSIGVPELSAAIWSGLKELALNGGVGPGDRSFPYRYPSLNQVQGLLTEQVVAGHRRELLELANLMVLMAAHSGPFAYVPSLGAPVADVLLRPLAAQGDCDGALTLAWLVSLGQNPRPKDYDKLFEEAAKACPGDPTPRWLWGQRMTEDATTAGGLGNRDLSESQSLARPITFFRGWVRDKPGSVLAHAGLADALTSEAVLMSYARSAPFTARFYARQGLDQYRQAVALQDSALLRAGVAQTESLLGKDTALADVAKLASSGPLPAVVRAVAARVQEHAHAFEEAAETLKHPALPAAPFQLRYQAAGSVMDRPALGQGLATGVLLADATQGFPGAASVDYFAFLPDYRTDEGSGLTLDDLLGYRCPSDALRRDLVVAGRSKDAVAVPRSAEPQCASGTSYLGFAEFVLGSGKHMVGPDAMQNLWRYAGVTDQAGRVVRAWMESGDPLAITRAGELAFLRKDYPAARDLFTRAITVPDTGAQTFDQPPTVWSREKAQEARLDLGLTLERLGDDEAATKAYAAVSDDHDERGAAANSRLGAIAVARHEAGAALPYLRRAVKLTEAQLGDPTDINPLSSSGAEQNNLAVALLDLDTSPPQALRMARDAVRSDPESPIYQDTLAQALEANGQTAAARRAYETNAVRDRSAYQTQNNLGVLEATKGHYRAAVDHLELAVRAKPDYALGWFNLGVALSQEGGPVNYLHAQAALAKAVRLDSGLRGASQDLVPDHSAVVSGLDISRPVPTGWTFSVARAPVQGLTWMLVLLAVWRIAFALGIDQIGSVVAERLLTSESHISRRWSRAWSRLNRYAPLRVAVIGAVLIGAWPFLGQQAPGATAALVVLAGFLSLTWLFVRISVDRSGQGQRRAWIPGLLFGAMSALLGFVFVPAPVAEDPDLPLRRRWLALAMLGSTAVVALILGRVTGFPVARVFGVGSLALLSTALFPLRPFDGAFLHHRLAELISGVALVVLSGSLALGWL